MMSSVSKRETFHATVVNLGFLRWLFRFFSHVTELRKYIYITEIYMKNNTNRQ